MKHWSWYFRKLKIMGSPLTDQSVYLARHRSPLMVTNLAGAVSNRHQRKYKPSMGAQPRNEGRSKSFLDMTGYLSKFIPRYASITKPLIELTHKNITFHWGPEVDNAFEELKVNISNKDIMAFFNPEFPIMVRVKASYNEGRLSGLFQQFTRGCQPVHFIGCRLTGAEKRCSQTEKDALCLKWAKD